MPRLSPSLLPFPILTLKLHSPSSNGYHHKTHFPAFQLDLQTAPPCVKFISLSAPVEVFVVDGENMALRICQI